MRPQVPSKPNRWKNLLLPFVLGYLVAYVSVRQDAIIRSMASDNSDSSSSINQQGGNQVISQDSIVDVDGWKSIQVFAGSPQEVEGQSRFHGQARQDELVAALLRNKTDGYFIDLAANDAHTLSNTAALEHFYQWKGLCIEPNPSYWYNLAMQRRCQVVAAVVGSTRDEPVFFRYEGGVYGGIAAQGFDNNENSQATSQKVFTVPLLEVFERNHVPKVIDYLSLDVEGAEGYIMMNFPLDHYKIKIITAERLKGDILGYLKQHGYEQYEKGLSTWGEQLWIHSEYRDELDMDAIDRFPFPIDWRDAIKN